MKTNSVHQGRSPLKGLTQTESNLSKRLLHLAIDYGIFWAMGTTIIVFAIIIPRFFTLTTLENVLMAMSIPAIVSLGLTFVLIAGNWDLSFGSTAGLVTMTTCYVISMTGGNVFLGILAGLGITLLVGFFNGIAIAYRRFSDLLTTIAMSSLLFGLSFLYSGGYEIHKHVRSSLGFFYYGHLGPIPFVIIFTLLVYLLVYLILNRSRLGRAFYATGGGEEAAVYSGANVRRLKMSAFIICAVLAGIGGILSAAQSGRAWVLLGQRFLLTDFTVAFLGWSIFGKPSVLGTFIGALFLSILRSALIMASAPYHLSDILTGLLLLIAIVIGMEKRKRA